MSITETLEAVTRAEVTTRMEEFLAASELETPFLVVDLDVVAERYRRLAASLPMARIHYAVKANPAPEVLRLLVGLDSRFDVASPAEIDQCIAAGAHPSSISYGNTVKKQRDIARAYGLGIRLFTIDSEAELAKVAEAAPGSTVCVRILADGAGADWPLSRKFGCEPAMAIDLALAAADLGLGVGFSFHVGSQQRNPGAWESVLGDVAAMCRYLRNRGVAPRVLNIGGGFPGAYRDDVPTVEVYGEAIESALRRHFGADLPAVIAEPGRSLVADAGVLRTEVVLVSRKSADDPSGWVFLDVGLFGGLPEVMGEAVKYRIRTQRDGGPTGPVVIAGPTCDSTDVLYEHSDYRLPLALRPGDHVDLLSTGAYTTTCASVGFNGLPPLRAHYLPSRLDADL